jgi:hypothetical protein
MELIGKIKHRKVYYVQVQGNVGWEKSLPASDWIAFVITDEENEDLMASSTKAWVNNHPSFICWVGKPESNLEHYIAEEIAWDQANQPEELIQTTAPTTHFYHVLDEGFWQATTHLGSQNYALDQVVCLDYTKHQAKAKIAGLIDKVNEGWVPEGFEV